MTDKPLFTLDAKARWRLAYDRQQWIIQRRVGSPRRSDSGVMLKSGWQAVSFIGSTKRTLYRCLREHGVELTAEAQAQLDTLPEQFMDFIAAPERFAAQWPEAA